MMNRETWQSLSTADRDAWDKLSDKGKQTVLDYIKARESQSRDRKPASQSRRINKHEYADNSDAQGKEDVDEDAPAELQISTHLMNVGAPKAPDLTKHVPKSCDEKDDGSKPTILSHDASMPE